MAAPQGWGAVQPHVLHKGPAGRRCGSHHLQDSCGAHQASEAVAAGAGFLQAGPGGPAVQGRA